MDLQSSFIPFMIGSISLIAFLGIRNVHLAKNTRDLCGKIIESACDIRRPSYPWKVCYVKQISFFLHRYMISNRALVCAIFSVLMFGLMIAILVISPEWHLVGLDLTPDYIKMASVALFFIGGTAATFATRACIAETALARKSLCLNVVTTLVAIDDSAFGRNSINELESILKRVEKNIEDPIKAEFEAKIFRLKSSISRS